eukprot:scaffold7774_cov430-Prasinococcus_capsulatus_cf.AAC.4
MFWRPTHASLICSASVYTRSASSYRCCSVCIIAMLWSVSAHTWSAFSYSACSWVPVPVRRSVATGSISCSAIWHNSGSTLLHTRTPSISTLCAPISFSNARPAWRPSLPRATVAVLAGKGHRYTWVCVPDSRPPPTLCAPAAHARAAIILQHVAGSGGPGTGQGATFINGARGGKLGRPRALACSACWSVCGRQPAGPPSRPPPAGGGGGHAWGAP